MAEPSQADVMKALQAGAFRSKGPASSSTYASFSDPVNNLTRAEGEGSKVNARKVYCFREGCGSVILSPGAADYVESPVTIIPDDAASPFPPTAASSSTHSFWHVPDPFTFDNVGYSRPDVKSDITLPPGLPGIGPSDKGDKKVKWLICAECDLGPIGWSYEGGKEAWVAVERVRYGDK